MQTITIINNLSQDDQGCVDAGFSPSDVYLSHAVMKMWTRVVGDNGYMNVYYHHDYDTHKEAYYPGTDYFPPVNITDIDQSSWSKDSDWKTWTVASESSWFTEGDFSGLEQDVWYLIIEFDAPDYQPFPETVIQVADGFENLIINLIYQPDPTRNCVYYAYVVNIDDQSTTYQLGTQPAFIGDL